MRKSDAKMCDPLHAERNKNSRNFCRIFSLKVVLQSTRRVVEVEVGGGVGKLV